MFYNRNDDWCKCWVNGARIIVGSTAEWEVSIVCATLDSETVQTHNCNLQGQYIFIVFKWHQQAYFSISTNGKLSVHALIVLNTVHQFKDPYLPHHVSVTMDKQYKRGWGVVHVRLASTNKNPKRAQIVHCTKHLDLDSLAVYGNIG